VTVTVPTRSTKVKVAVDPKAKHGWNRSGALGGSLVSTARSVDGCAL
jgi:hypothetical protein